MADSSDDETVYFPEPVVIAGRGQAEGHTLQDIGPRPVGDGGGRDSAQNLVSSTPHLPGLSAGRQQEEELMAEFAAMSAVEPPHRTGNYDQDLQTVSAPTMGVGARLKQPRVRPRDTVTHGGSGDSPTILAEGDIYGFPARRPRQGDVKQSLRDRLAIQDSDEEEDRGVEVGAAGGKGSRPRDASLDQHRSAVLGRWPGQREDKRVRHDLTQDSQSMWMCNHDAQRPSQPYSRSGPSQNSSVHYGREGLGSYQPTNDSVEKRYLELSRRETRRETPPVMWTDGGRGDGVRESYVDQGNRARPGLGGYSAPQQRNGHLNAPQLFPQPHRARKAPEWTGKGDFDTFVVQFELAAAINGWGEETMAIELALCLRGDATVTLGLLEPAERMSYQTLKRALMDRYQPREQTIMYMNKLRSRTRMRSESLLELAVSLRKMTKLAFPGASKDMHRRTVFAQFLQALSPDPQLEWAVLAADPQDLESALAAGQRFESWKETRGQDKKGGADTSTFYMMQPEITEKEEGGKATRDPPPPPPPRKLTPRTCYLCGAPGHFMYQCPERKHLMKSPRFDDPPRTPRPGTSGGQRAGNGRP